MDRTDIPPTLGDTASSDVGTKADILAERCYSVPGDRKPHGMRRLSPPIFDLMVISVRCNGADTLEIDAPFRLCPSLCLFKRAEIPSNGWTGTMTEIWRRRVSPASSSPSRGAARISPRGGANFHEAQGQPSKNGKVTGFDLPFLRAHLQKKNRTSRGPM